MAPIPRDNTAPHHEYTEEQNQNAYRVCIALLVLAAVAIFVSLMWKLHKGKFEKKREDFKHWKQARYWKRVRKADKGKMPEVPAAAHLEGPEVVEADRIMENLTPAYLKASTGPKFGSL